MWPKGKPKTKQQKNNLSEHAKKRGLGGFNPLIHTPEVIERARQTRLKSLNTPEMKQFFSQLAKGRPSKLRGSKLSEEHKRHISEGLYKVMGTPEMRQKISQIAKQKGIGKWMPKGVLPESIRKHLETMKPFKCEERPRQGEESRYTTWRTAVFTRDDFTCQVCLKRGGQLEAHHIKSWAKFPELRYVVSNGKTVCKEPCHKILNKEQRQNEM